MAVGFHHEYAKATDTLLGGQHKLFGHEIVFRNHLKSISVLCTFSVMVVAGRGRGGEGGVEGVAAGGGECTG